MTNVDKFGKMSKKPVPQVVNEEFVMVVMANLVHLLEPNAPAIFNKNPSRWFKRVWYLSIVCILGIMFLGISPSPIKQSTLNVYISSSRPDERRICDFPSTLAPWALR